MSKLSKELERLNTLKGICPEFYIACKSLWFVTFKAEQPAMSTACGIYLATHNADPNLLINELTYYELIERYKIYMPEICKHLIDFYAKSNEPECTMTLLRWMRDNGYITDELEPLRL